MSAPRFAAAVALALAGCASGASSQANDVAGCYQFDRNAGARALALPWGLVLEDEPLGPGWPVLEQRAGVRKALTASSPTARMDHPFAYWAPAAADSIEIGHPGGGGVALTLAPAGRDLSGLGVAIGDAVPLGGTMGPRPPYPVIARRVTCGAS